MFSKNLKSPTEGLFTHTISVPVSDTVTLKVYHCAYGNGAFDREIGFETHSVHYMKFDGDVDGNGDMVCGNVPKEDTIYLHDTHFRGKGE